MQTGKNVSSRPTRDVQAKLAALGLYQGAVDGDFGPKTTEAVIAFQKSAGYRPTGDYGNFTDAALFAAKPGAPDPKAPKDEAACDGDIIPANWLPDARMNRIHIHWTAGGYDASELDREHYHVLIEGDGKPVRGKPSIKDNAHPVTRAYAPHTLNANTGAIGVSMCAMRGAVQQPFNSGPSPLTKDQWDACVRGVSQMCRRYGIPVTPETVLTHAEVQSNLGIKQRGKWDIAILPFDPEFNTAKACGDRLRAEVLALIQGA